MTEKLIEPPGTFPRTFLDFPLVAQVEAAVAALDVRIRLVGVVHQEVAEELLCPDVVAIVAAGVIREGMLLDLPEKPVLRLGFA